MDKEQFSLKNISKQPLIQLNPKKATLEEIKVSTLIRIAESTEIMAKNYTDLLSDLKKMDQKNNTLLAENQALKRTISNNRSLITKMQQKTDAA
ncbi:hypothetical protein [Flavobacterium sp. GNP002]